MSTHKKMLWGIVIVLGLVVLFVLRSGATDGNGNAPVPLDGITATSSRESIVNAPDIDYGFVKASSTPAEVLPGVPLPDLDRPVLIPKGFSPDIALSAQKHLQETIALLKQSKGNATLWAELGFSRKGIEDYEGAKQAYEYALALMPGSAIFADNLGVLYGNYLNDYGKAEKNFKLAITLDPKTPYRYLRLFEFYRYVLKDIGKAKSTLQQGSVALPGDTSFAVLLETLD